ncbi:MAG TPA: antitoxin [bacterium]
MRTTLTLADDVYQAAKTLAEGAGRPLGEVVSELIRRGLMPQGMQTKEGGLPLFQVPAEAEIIPGNRARELLSDEGME